MEKGQQQSLLDLFGEAAAEVKQEDLQEAWDRWLMTHSLGNIYMTKLCLWFANDHRLTWEQFNALKRTPRFKRHMHTLPSRFMAAYVPGMWERLVNNASHDVIIAYLKKHQPETLNTPADERKSTREAKERSQTEAHNQRHKLEMGGMAHFYEQAQDRNWKKVKAVRSK